MFSSSSNRLKNYLKFRIPKLKRYFLSITFQNFSFKIYENKFLTERKTHKEISIVRIFPINRRRNFAEKKKTQNNDIIITLLYPYLHPRYALVPCGCVSRGTHKRWDKIKENRWRRRWGLEVRRETAETFSERTVRRVFRERRGRTTTATCRKRAGDW